GVIDKYNSKIKVGSSYVESITDYVGEKIVKHDQKNLAEEYSNLENVSPSFQSKAEVAVFEEEIDKVETKVEEKPKTG
ncbi:9262_t:CDS:1, partial [Paraglomus occultum]